MSLIQNPRPSAVHASFDVLAVRKPDGSELRVGLTPGARFSQIAGGKTTGFDQAVAGAQALALKDGAARLVINAHVGLLFVVPVMVRGADGRADVQLAADLKALDGLELLGRHAKALALVGADRTIDLRQLSPTLGSGRG